MRMTQVVTKQEPLSLRALLKPGISAVRCHWPAFVFFQIVSLLLVIGYFRVEAVHNFCQKLSTFKNESGLLFAPVVAVIAGVLFPELAKRAFEGARYHFNWKQLPSLVLFFAVYGVITDLQYRLMALLYGNSTDFSVALCKMLTDQFITTPIWGVPYWILVYAWRDQGYRIVPTLKLISPRWYLTSVLPLLVSAWCYWLPIVLMIYSLPGPLQFSLFASAMAAWSIIIVFVAAKQTPSSDARQG